MNKALKIFIILMIVFISGYAYLNLKDDIFPSQSNSNEFEVSPNAWSNFTKPDDETLKATLTALQYEVTQKDATEKPFYNEFWDNHEDGLYVDIVSGEPLFSSLDKFDSGSGWPSFLKPIDQTFIVEKDDYKLVVHRTELRSRYADSHLGHIILDGPESNNYVRYCINSAALRFVPLSELDSEGLTEYWEI